MDKKYLDLLDSVQAAANLALAITMNSADVKKKEVSDRYLEDLMKEIWRTRQALCEVMKMQQYEVHDVYLHLVLISGYHDEDRDQTPISIRQICYDTGLSLSAVRHSLKVLISAGLLTRSGITWTVKKFVLDKPISPRIRSEKKRTAAENLERERIIKEEQSQREKEEKRKYQEEIKAGKNPLKEMVKDLMKRAQNGDEEAAENLMRYKSIVEQIKQERQ